MYLLGRWALSPLREACKQIPEVGPPLFSIHHPCFKSSGHFGKVEAAQFKIWAFLIPTRKISLDWLYLKFTRRRAAQSPNPRCLWLKHESCAKEGAGMRGAGDRAGALTSAGEVRLEQEGAEDFPSTPKFTGCESAGCSVLTRSREPQNSVSALTECCVLGSNWHILSLPVIPWFLQIIFHTPLEQRQYASMTLGCNVRSSNTPRPPTSQHTPYQPTSL